MPDNSTAANSASVLPRLAVHGAAGRMGRQLLSAIAERKDVVLGAALERPGENAVGVSVDVLVPEFRLAEGSSASVKTVSDSATAVIDDVDVLIDFTRPAPSMALLETALQHKTAIVIGTTGFSAPELTTIREAAERIPVLQAANFSVGVTLALSLLADAASVLGDDYDVEVIEAHHRHKVDAPSGTAVAMGQVLADALGRNLAECAVYGREGHTGERDAKTIGFETIRGGDIIGEHTVLFAGLGERIEITHKATDRRVFARGAVRAAQWLAGQPAGMYDMNDVLGLKA